MSDRILPLILILFLLGLSPRGVSQESPGSLNNTPLFNAKEPIALKLQYSIKELKKKTNDSTYMRAILIPDQNGSDSIPIKIRARGKFRRDNCYFIPLKVKISKKASRNTLFEGNRKFKLVLPCLMQKNKNDYVVKEYLAYSIFELISPYHFKTVLTHIAFVEEKGSRTIKHNLKGILIEDSDQVEKRYQGREMEKKVHPLYQDAVNAIRNNLFQFMIGNTDYSTRGGHNEKLFYLDNKYISLPYDFDLSGLVNPDYAYASDFKHASNSIPDLTSRVYQGYQRERPLIEQVRKEFLLIKDQVLEKLLELEPEFEEKQQFKAALQFLNSFYSIIENDSRFEYRIVNKAKDLKR